MLDEINFKRSFHNDIIKFCSRMLLQKTLRFRVAISCSIQLTYSLHTIDINRILQSVTLQTGTFDVEFSWNEDTVDGILKWISFWSDKKAFSDIHDVKYVQIENSYDICELSDQKNMLMLACKNRFSDKSCVSSTVEFKRKWILCECFFLMYVLPHNSLNHEAEGTDAIMNGCKQVCSDASSL